MARKPDPGTRDRILDTASRLFDEHGVHAVGMQQIIDECGCGKNLLYREFGSKDDLVAAYLARCREDWQAIVDRAAELTPGEPADRLVVIVDAVAEHAAAPGFRGCPVRNAHAEFPDPAHLVNRIAVQHYADRRAYLYDLAEEAGARDAHAVADRITLIIDGVNSNGAVLGGRGAAEIAVAFAREVVGAATSGALDDAAVDEELGAGDVVR